MIRTLLKFFIRTIPLFALLLIIIELIVTNELAGLGREVSTMDSTIAVTHEENEQLSEQIASESSLIAIAVKAKELGFIEPSKSQYMTLGPEQFPVALNQPR